jgi:hypothetical protein
MQLRLGSNGGLELLSASGHYLKNYAIPSADCLATDWLVLSGGPKNPPRVSIAVRSNEYLPPNKYGGHQDQMAQYLAIITKAKSKGIEPHILAKRAGLNVPLMKRLVKLIAQCPEIVMFLELGLSVTIERASDLVRTTTRSIPQLCAVNANNNAYYKAGKG